MPEPSGVATHIASGTKVVGQISGTAELVIDGEVEGQIDLDSRVIIGASGRVKGEIQARAIEVGGKVHGNVRGRERVEVLTTGGLEGDVVSPRVVIAEGAFFKGKVEMADPSRREPKSGGPSGSGGPPGGQKGRPGAGGQGAPGPLGAGKQKAPTTVATKHGR
jgi:cytoskeletal protein CcmA (bactofilin family)